MQIEKFNSGRWEQQHQYKSFLPVSVNQGWEWLDPKVNTLLEQAARALAELNALSLMVPDVDLFIRMHIIKEANGLIQKLMDLNILQESTGCSRNRVFVFKRYLSLFMEQE